MRKPCVWYSLVFLWPPGEGYGYFELFNNINSEKKINSRLVEVKESKRVKNYVYRLISEKRYKKLVNLKEIYKFSDIE